MACSKSNRKIYYKTPLTCPNSKISAANHPLIFDVSAYDSSNYEIFAQNFGV